jgi:hypothetical protein
MGYTDKTLLQSSSILNDLTQTEKLALLSGTFIS